ncbi:MAG: sigma-70 family RNA polymerase sigma factor [Tannerella sp.]|jgi:RNA polymerase sigma-70 factor (ECF subfamily)|nr:sigma-70 family RNA polymerase sigma factor [Tannerella sp.]
MFTGVRKSDLSDDELLRRYLDDADADCFGELYNRYIPLLYGIGLKYLNDVPRAEDAVMELFEIIFPKMAQYEVKTFKTWIFTVMKNHCLQTIRRDSREIVVDFNSEIMESDEILHLFENEDDNGHKEALNKCIEKLPDNQRNAIIRFFVDDLSYQDIAESSQYTVNKVKSYIQNGKRNLKICIERNSK